MNLSTFTAVHEDLKGSPHPSKLQCRGTRNRQRQAVHTLPTWSTAIWAGISRELCELNTGRDRPEAHSIDTLGGGHP